MMNSGVYILDKKFNESLNQFRFQNLIQSDSFRASPEAVSWNESDEKGKVLSVVTSQGEILSSMRAEIIHDSYELSQKLDFDDLDNHITLPVGLLGKASTDGRYRSSGFNTYLRYLAYQYFYKNNIRYVVGTMIPNAPRLNLLRELGYQFIENKAGWHRYGYKSDGKTLVGYLDLKSNYDQIMQTLEEKVSRNKKLYPFYEN
jgi:hypothetical protein